MRRPSFSLAVAALSGFLAPVAGADIARSDDRLRGGSGTGRGESALPAAGGTRPAPVPPAGLAATPQIESG